MATGLKIKPETPVTTIGRYRWVICGLLFFATTINYMDRQILSLLKPILDNQRHWRNEQGNYVIQNHRPIWPIRLLPLPRAGA